MKQELISKMDNLLTYISGINDERDSVPLLLAVRECWNELRAELVAKDNV
jgi:hypothetical protein